MTPAADPADHDGGAGLLQKAAALEARLTPSARSSSPIAAASTARFSPSPRPGSWATRALCVTADSPSYPDHHRDLAIGTARAFNLRHEMVATSEVEHPEYRANPANRCYYCKHELYTHLTRHRARARVRGRRRRQQRRRPRRLPARPPGGPRVRRAQPAGRSRPDEGRDPRAGAARRDVHLGRAGVGVPVVADSVPHRSHRGETADDRRGRARAARPRVPHLPRAPSRHHRAARAGPRGDRARASSRRWRPRSTASCARSATRT